jgi:hypothetical protein
LLTKIGKPEWPFGNPLVPKTEEEKIWSEVGHLLESARNPECVVAGDPFLKKIFASKHINQAARDRLPKTFDGFPATNDYPFGKKYLNLHPCDLMREGFSNRFMALANSRCAFHSVARPGTAAVLLQ